MVLEVTMGTKITFNSFLGGEVSPSLYGRSDDVGYKTGASRLQNFIVNPQGSIRSRSGFEFVYALEDNSSNIRLIPFRFSSDQTLVLVFGVGYMSVLSKGMVAISNGQPYKMSIPPITEQTLSDLHYSQNADVIMITSPSIPPIEIKRYNTTDWRWNYINTGATLSAPSGLWQDALVTPTFFNPGAGIPAQIAEMNQGTHWYVVTALDDDGNESSPSPACEARGNYNYTGVKIKLRWNAVEGASRYRVYRAVAGVYCYIGETADTTLEDDGPTPDGSITPPRYKSPFVSSSTGSVETTETVISITSQGTGYTYGYNKSGLLYTPHSLRLKTLPSIIITQTVDLNNVLTHEPTNNDFNDKSANLYVTASCILLNSKGSRSTAVPLNNYAATLIDSKTTSWKQDGDNYYPRIVNRYALTANKDILINLSGASYKDSSFSVKIELSLNTAPNLSDETISIANHSESAVLDLSTKVNDEFTYQQTVYKDTTLQGLYGNGVNLITLINNTTQTDCETEIPLYATSDGKEVDVVAIAVNGQCIDTKSYVDLGILDNNIYVVNSNGKGATFTVEKKTTTKNGDNPSCSTQYDQRRVFAGSNEHPLKIWMTNAGKQSLMNYHIPSLSDDRIEVEAVTTDADRIKHVIALQSLLLMTGSAELRVFTQNSDKLTSESIAIKAQSYIGSNDVQPVVVNSTVVFSGNRGGHVYGMVYTYSADGYSSSDISIRATHLFDGYTVKDIALSKAPVQIVWCVSSSGDLLACTFYTDQKICAWSRIVTDGKFEHCTVVTEGNEDHLYVVVNRNGKHFVERMSNFTVSSDKTTYRYMDSYLDAKFETPTLNVDGLSHLEDKEVAVFVDGIPQSNKRVKNGRITLDKAGYNIAVGLPYLCKFESLPITAQTTSQLQGTIKNVSEVFMRLMYDGDVYTNLSSAKKLYTVKRDDKYIKPLADKAKTSQVTVDGNWEYDAQLVLEHRDCLPLEIQAITYNLNIENTRTF